MVCGWGLITGFKREHVGAEDVDTGFATAMGARAGTQKHSPLLDILRIHKPAADSFS
jgi:hypothetical protein